MTGPQHRWERELARRIDADAEAGGCTEVNSQGRATGRIGSGHQHHCTLRRCVCPCHWDAADWEAADQQIGTWPE